MEIKEIKKLAREKMKGHFWEVFKPLLFACLISWAISFVITLVFKLAGVPLETVTNVDFGFGEVPTTTSTPIGSLVNLVISYIEVIVSFGAIYYLLNYIRGKKVTKDEIIEMIKSKWLPIVVATFLMTVFVCLWSFLLIIPGIIAAIAYSLTMFVLVDEKVNGYEAIKKSKEMMKGYKWKYVVLQLSFLGWLILGVFTLGILYIWLIPYMELADLIFYDKLKEIRK